MKENRLVYKDTEKGIEIWLSTIGIKHFFVFINGKRCLPAENGDSINKEVINKYIDGVNNVK